MTNGQWDEQNELLSSGSIGKSDSWFSLLAH